MPKKTSMSEFLRDSLNSTMGEGVAYKMNEATPSTVKGYISTGSTLLDIAISNKKDGGIPLGRLTEITGVESIGKSLMAAHVLADCQKQGGVAVLIDTENAASMEILQKCGVNLDELVYLQLGTTEEVFKAMESIIQKVRSENKKVDKNILIVWDSVAATSTGAEIAGDYGAHTIGLQARLISQGLRKIIPFIGKYNVTLLFLNQLRTKIGVMFGDPMVTPGGKAIPYFASVRVRLFKEAELKEPKTKAVQGVVVKAKVNKCKIAPPLRQASFTIRFGRGIQDIESWLDPLASFGEIQQGGGWYMYKEKRFRRADFVDFVQKNGFEEELRDLLYDHLIIKIDEDNQAIEMVDEGEKLNGEED